MGILFYAFSETQALTPEGMMDQLEKNTAVDDIWFLPSPFTMSVVSQTNERHNMYLSLNCMYPVLACYIFSVFLYICAWSVTQTGFLWH